jgi:hypothetical protein
VYVEDTIRQKELSRFRLEDLKKYIDNSSPDKEVQEIKLAKLEEQVQSLRYYIKYPNLLQVCTNISSLNKWLEGNDCIDIPKVHHMLTAEPVTKDLKVLSLW